MDHRAADQSGTEQAMLQVGSAVTSYAVEATDGRIGSVSDFLFDDALWTVRWLVLDMGTWLPGRKLLLPPASIIGTDDAAKQLAVALTKAEVRGSLGMSEDQPVSRQMEDRLHEDHDTGAAAPLPEDSAAGGAATTPFDAAPGDPHLRSLAALMGYEIEADEGAAGFFEDILVDPATWAICYLIIGTSNLREGEHLLVPPAAVHGISWAGRQIRLDMTRDSLLASPPWNKVIIVNEETERLPADAGWPESRRE
jgi:hypothetical protein